jgi:hypothetical protein
VDLDNVIVGGRCISCEPEAIRSIRLTATCFATGQAAGVMGALAAKAACPAASVPYSDVREALLAQGSILEGIAGQ